MARWIIDHFPPEYQNMIYLEPFSGSGAVFFNKKPSVIETLNDIDGDIVNLFFVLREYPEELRRVLDLTPYSREEYDQSFAPCDDPIERARRYIIKTSQAIGAKMNGKCGWRNHKTLKIGGTACKWHGISDTIDEASRRLRGSSANLVQIEHMDALRLIERYNTRDALIYIDPPYIRSTRKSGALYKHEMDDQQHVQMLEIIKYSKAKILISGYHSELYGKHLHNWECDSVLQQTTSTHKAREFIWANYAFNQKQLTFLT